MISRASLRAADVLASGTIWDVLVVGAGPAGATAARILAADGHDVLLVDRHDFPREKVCGDALIPDALHGLRRAGLYHEVASRAFPADTLSVYSASGIRVDIPGQYVTLRRQELDHLLLQAADAAGATFLVDTITDLRHGEREVTARLGQSGLRVRARFAVVATGADLSLLGQIRHQPYRRPTAIALRCYVRSPVDVERLVISYDRAIAPGYAWVFPLGNHEYNVGCGVFTHHAARAKLNLRHAFQRFTERFPLARELWDARRDATRLKGAPLRCGLDADAAYGGPAILAIGETIGATFPFTGEGVGKAIETGELAAKQIGAALRTGDTRPLRRFPAVLQHDLAPRYEGYRVAQDWLGSAWLGDLVAKQVQRSPELQQTVIGVINEAANPQTLFSWKRLLPELLPWRSKRRNRSPRR